MVDSAGIKTSHSHYLRQEFECHNVAHKADPWHIMYIIYIYFMPVHCNIHKDKMVPVAGPGAVEELYRMEREEHRPDYLFCEDTQN